MTTQRNRKAFIAAAAVMLLVGTEAVAVIGRPLTPMSYAGVARRTAVRTTAMVGTAAVVGTAAAATTAAAMHALPAGCYAGSPCGGVVYQPVYQGTSVVYVPQ